MRTLTGFLRDEVERTGRRGVVVGLSGGIDSSVAAYLAARALRPEAVHGLILPHRSSSPDSVSDAIEVGRRLELQTETIDVSPIVDAFVEVAGEVDRVRLGNIMARARMIALFDRSAEHDSVVLGTSNKTELLLGYGTLHGDLACAVNPLGDLYKTQVRSIAVELGVPRSILAKAPSADLWPDQSDEQELGFGYEELDRLLVLLVDGGVDREAVIERGFSPEMVRRVTERIAEVEFKRRLPAMARLSERSAGWEYRCPRDWRK